MKIALWMQDGIEQIVLTPETDTETWILAKMHDGTREVSLKRGSFYECQGGWVRQLLGDSSTIVVLRPVEASQGQSGPGDPIYQRGQAAVEVERRG